jgi:hypothetical protein
VKVNSVAVLVLLQVRGVTCAQRAATKSMACFAAV